jgi:hypothetical protein
MWTFLSASKNRFYCEVVLTSGWQIGLISCVFFCPDEGRPPLSAAGYPVQPSYPAQPSNYSGPAPQQSQPGFYDPPPPYPGLSTSQQQPDMTGAEKQPAYNPSLRWLNGGDMTIRKAALSYASLWYFVSYILKFNFLYPWPNRLWFSLRIIINIAFNCKWCNRFGTGIYISFLNVTTYTVCIRYMRWLNIYRALS